MASTDSTATSGRVFTPPIWRPNELKSKEENAASFRAYVTDLKEKMNSHLEFLEQEISRAGKGKKEIGESSRKRKREIERDGCGDWPVIIIESEREKLLNDPKEGGEKEGNEEDARGENTPEEDGKEEGGESEEGEDTEGEEETEEDDETDENAESDMNSESETRSEEKAIAESDVSFGSESHENDDDDDDDSGTKSDSGNYQGANEETSEDSSMFAMKIPD